MIDYYTVWVYSLVYSVSIHIRVHSAYVNIPENPGITVQHGKGVLRQLLMGERSHAANLLWPQGVHGCQPQPFRGWVSGGRGCGCVDEGGVSKCMRLRECRERRKNHLEIEWFYSAIYLLT